MTPEELAEYRKRRSEMKPSCRKVLSMLKRGWCSNYHLINSCSLSALSRVMELRSLGFDIEVKRRVIDDRVSNTYLYRVKP